MKDGSQGLNTLLTLVYLDWLRERKSTATAMPTFKVC